MKMPFPDRSLHPGESMAIPVLFLKTHVRGYYRQSGGYWSPHERHGGGGGGGGDSHPSPHPRLAPNGKPSNLNEAQWHLVRTPEFKAWFGDWEKAAVNKFLNGEPVAEMHGDEVPKFHQVRDLAKWVADDWHVRHGNAVNNPQLGRIIIDHRSATASIGHGLKAIKAQGFYLVPDGIRQGRVLGKLEKKNEASPDAYLIGAPVKIGGEVYKLYIEVRKDANMQRMYVHEVVLRKPQTAFKIAAASSSEKAEPHAAHKPGAIRSLAQSIAAVNPDSISKPVDENGEPTPKAIQEYMNLHKAQPTQAQIQAGNYKKGHRRFRGLDISIENPAGSTRSGTDPDGHGWSIKMKHDYGYIRGSLGVAPDGDHVDVYVGPDEDAESVYIVHQRKAGHWKDWDEDKCMIGFPDKESAVAAYLAHYDDPRFLGPVTTLSFAGFKDKVLGHAGKPKMIKSIPLLFVRAAA
ncbi:hypothetical protein [Methylomagnum ishizawai]|uniref:hypothetical protein n=1 Tax=Methylomagnum ishizawai TaxID=1760988 RepID=UPI001C323B0B|nr:hypothetical protein [Methylomagnum ishizawai]BBL75434.1 hypothetical protein MishRS11D_25320 [Methylomagnum ishizawai]